MSILQQGGIYQNDLPLAMAYGRRDNFKVIAQYLMKKPILVLGIVLMGLLLYDLRKRGILFQRHYIFSPTSCKSVKLNLKKRLNWDFHCKNNILVVNISEKFNQKAKLYRSLANHLHAISVHSPTQNLQRTDKIIVKINAPSYIVIATITGENLAKLKTLPIKNFPDFFKSHVLTQETAKNR